MSLQRGLPAPLTYGATVIETLQVGRMDYDACSTGAQVRDLIQGLEDVRAIFKAIAEAIASGDKLKSLQIASMVCQDLSRAVDHMQNRARFLDDEAACALLERKESELLALAELSRV